MLNMPFYMESAPIRSLVNKYKIDWSYIDAFLRSMDYDLVKTDYSTREGLTDYIYGSAEVVGLMCLKVFCKEDETLYDQLFKYARSLGSAFQKVNFLRDISSDTNELGRIYFPELTQSHLSEEVKSILIRSIERNFDNIPQYLRSLMQVNPKHIDVLFRSFWQQVGRYFDAKETQQIISLIAFFLGRTPFDTNAVYTLLSYIEFKHKGYYNVEGGMYTIVSSLLSELEKMNVKFHYNTEIVDFEAREGKLISLIDKDGKKWNANIFVINSDAAYFRGKVLKRNKFSDGKLQKMSWTMGYLTFYLGVDTKLPQVDHHNYFLGNNYEEYAKNVMQHPGTIEKPYYYVNVVSKYNPDCAPVGNEALFFVCPVPNLLYKTDWVDKEDIIDSIVADFSKRIHRDISKNIVFRKSFTPEDWHDRFNLYKGAGLGLSHAMNQIGAFRPKNADEEFDNTFYVGASTVPGAGLPMAIISSKLAVERILKAANE